MIGQLACQYNTYHQKYFRNERDTLKINNIDMKQELLELKSKIEFSEQNTLVIAQRLVETNAK